MKSSGANIEKWIIGYYQIQQKIYFGSKDPQLILDMDSRDIKKLQIKCKFETNIMKLKEDIEKEYLNLNLKWNNNIDSIQEVV